MAYYWLDEETYDAVKFHITELADPSVLDRLEDKEGEFMRQFIQNLEKYDRNLKCSPKQQNWLKSLYTKYVIKADEELESTDKRFERWSKE